MQKEIFCSFQNKFITMDPAQVYESSYYILPLVILYFLIVMAGSYSSLAINKELFNSKEEKAKNIFHLYSSFVFGGGFWFVHYAGMLSHEIRTSFTYGIVSTITFIALMSLISFVAINIIRKCKSSIIYKFLSSVLITIVVSSTFYFNLNAEGLNNLYNLNYVLLTIAMLFITSFFMVFNIYKLKENKLKQSLYKLSIVIGVGYGIAHYIGMKSVVFKAGEDCCSNLMEGNLNEIPSEAVIIIFILAIILLFRLRLLKKNTSKSKATIWDFLPRIIILIGLLITSLGIVGLNNIKLKQDKSKFISLINDTEAALSERYSKYEQALKGAKGLFSASSYVSREEWEKFSKAQNIEISLPGINGIGFIEYVENANLPEFLIRTRRGYPNFINHPDTNFDDKLIIKYVEPEENNAAAIGLDVGFEKNRREAAETSRLTGKPSLTRKIDLVQDSVKRAGFLLFLPLDEVNNKFKGWVYAPFIGEYFLKDLKGVSNEEITYAVYDGGQTIQENLIYKKKNFVEEYTKGQLTHQTTIKIAEKKWTIKWQTTDNFHHSFNDWTLFMELLIGVLITFLLAFIAYSQNARTKLVEITVDEKTKELNSEKRFSELIINTIPDIFFVKDKEFNLLKTNEAFLSLYPEEAHNTLIGTTGIESHDPKEVELYLAEDKKAFKEGISKVLETITLYDGSSVTLDTTKVRFENEFGEEFILGISRDVSALQEAKENLELLVEERTAELQQANASKDMFLANMSHELRTPLNSILGLIKLLLLEDNVSDDYKDTLRVIEKSASSLLEIVNDILDLSKIDADKIIIEHKPFNVSGLMYSLLEMIKPLASQKGLDLKSNVKELEKLNVIGDEFRLSRIILNLTSNAIKYTPEGCVEIDVQVEKISDDKVNFIMNIIDTGIGIDDDKIDHIFEKFTQAEESTERNFGGTGLGLNITKKLVNLMGGSISVESKIGKGSKFSFTLPFNLIELEAIEPDTENFDVTKRESNRIAFRDAKVLIAEDHEFNQIFAMKLLRQYGCNNYELVVNGSDAIEEFKSNEYDVILMDCHMPKINGYNATKKIREIEASNKNAKKTPIIAMTADAMRGTREACLEVGMDEYISKPIDIDLFKTVLERWFIFNNEIEKPVKRPVNDKKAKLVNLDVLNEYTDGDEEQNKELLKIFYEKSLNDIEKLSQNLVDGVSEEWSRHGHGLKGASAYIGADILYALAEKAQNMLDCDKKDREVILLAIKENHAEICKYLINKKLLLK